MRILIVHNILWAHYKSSVFQALQQLTDQQSDITVKVLQIARNELSRASLESTGDRSAPNYVYQYELLFDRFLEEVGLVERSRALYQRARVFKPIVLLLTGYYDPAQLLLLFWARLNGIRVVMQIESTALDERQGGWKERLKRFILGQCDGFFCFGSQSAQYLIQSGVRPEKILLRRNSVDNDTLRLAYEQAQPNRLHEQDRLNLCANNFIYVGRLIPAKNLPTLLAAYSEARQQSSADWGLLLLGDGPEDEKLRQQANSLNLADSVHFLPGRAWYRVPEVLALSDVLVLPSLSEPWGLVANEALACGLPVIASNRCGCVPDLVHDGENGFVFDPATPAQLTALLLRFMNGNVNRQAMQVSARQSVVSYSPAAVAQGMLNGFFTVAGLGRS